MASKFFVNQRACRIYTAGCVNKMEVSVTGPRAVNELGGPVIPGISYHVDVLFRTSRLGSIEIFKYQTEKLSRLLRLSSSFR